MKTTILLQGGHLRFYEITGNRFFLCLIPTFIQKNLQYFIFIFNYGIINLSGK